MTEAEYEKLRTKCIDTYGTLFKDSLVFDACKVDKVTRVRLQQDVVYVTETKAKKARLFCDQLDLLDAVVAGNYVGDKPGDQSSVVLKAMEMKTKLLFDDLNVNKDESNALNITFVAMDREAFENEGTVEVVEGSSDAQLGADFGEAGDDESFESRMKAQVKERMAKAKAGKDGADGTAP